MSPEPVISSRQNPRFKAAFALREARERRRQGRLLVDGAREIVRAIGSGARVLEAWAAPDAMRSPAIGAALVAARAAGAEVIEASPELLARLAYGERDEGLVIVVERPPATLEGLALGAEPLVIVVDGVEKPGNLGAVMRSADGAGVDAIILSDPVSDPWNPNAIRASLGTILSLPLAVASAAEVLAWLREARLRIVAARVDAALDYDGADLRGGLALVVGSEDEGLGDAWRADDVMAVRIPMLGQADSLNVAVSAAILLYEARRQRRLGP